MFHNTGFHEARSDQHKAKELFSLNVLFMCLQRLLKVLVANQGLEKNKYRK